VPAGFLPATGRLDHLVFPPGARCDSGVAQGDSISPWYDPMIAKIITHGPTRAVALSKLIRALAQTQVAGTVTNLAFLGALSRHAGFARGDVDTGLIARDLAMLVASPKASGAIRALAVLVGADMPMDAQAGFTLWAPLRQRVALCHEGETIDAILEPLDPHAARVEIDGETHLATRRDSTWRIDGAPRLPARRTGAKVTVFAPDGAFTFTPVDPLARHSATLGDGSTTLSPMPGTVKSVCVVPGQAVTAGDRLCVLEAMKMEHSLTAARSGVVAEVLAVEGQQVEAGAALIVLEAEA
jgi:3-methylcrotonyl-CoA carboxylase alpha subunit